MNILDLNYNINVLINILKEVETVEYRNRTPKDIVERKRKLATEMFTPVKI